MLPCDFHVAGQQTEAPMSADDEREFQAGFYDIPDER
jgi:hypothetical protein